MARRRRKRQTAKAEDKTQGMRRTTASTSDLLSPSTKHIASDDYFSEERGKRQKLEQRQEEATDKNGKQEHGDETDLLQDDVTLLTSLIYPGSEDQRKQSLGQRSRPEEEEDEEEENESPILVTCDRNEGRLYLSKLRVVVNERCRTKCIRTGSTWWTPNEFQFVSGRGAAKDWKRTVKHNGQCLKTLLTKGTISLNAIPPKCFCKSCEHKEEGKTSLSTVDQKEQQQELAPSLCSALETQDVADKKSVDGVKVESGGHEVKRSKLRTIKGHRRAKLDIKDIEDRKRSPSGLPVKKKLRKSRPEPVLDGVLEERQGHVEGLLDLQEVRDRQGSLVFRLSSSSFEHVIRSPNDVISRSSNRLNSVSAFEGQRNDHDVTRSVPPIEAKAEQELPGNISEEHSVSERPSDDVIVREPNKTLTSSQETKEEASLNTGYDVGQPSSSSSSSFASYQCNERAPEAPEAHVDAGPETDVAESASGDSSTATDKNSKGNVIGDGVDDVTGGAVSDVTSLTSSSPTASVATATRRKSAYLCAVIEELKRRKRSREAEVIAPAASGGGGGGGGMEGQKMTAASVTLSSLKISPMAESMKSEIEEKTDDDGTAVTCGRPPAESFDGLSDVMSSCLKPNPTGGGGGRGGGGGSLVHPESREEKNSSGLRKSDPESRDRKKAFPPPPPPSSLQAAWPTTPSKAETDRKQEAAVSSGDRKFGISRGKPEPRVTSSLETTMTSPLNISHLASIYGLNASPLTSLPLSPLQFPFFPPYLFMGFPLHPLLPQFSSSTSGASLPVPPPVTSSTFGSSQQQQQQKQRRMTHQQSSLAADQFGALLKPRPASSSNSSSSQLQMMWRPLVTDFSSADQWSTGSSPATNATGNSKPHSGTARHPIWRPEMAPLSPSLRKHSQRSFEEKTTMAQRSRAHAQKEAEMTSLVAANNRYKSEFLVPANVSRKLRSGEKEEEEEEGDEAAGGTGGRAGKSALGAYSCDVQGVLDLSSK